MGFPSSSTGAVVGNRMTGGKDIIPKGFQKGQLQQFTPEQMQLFGSLFGHLQPGSFLSRLSAGEPQLFEQLEAPAFRQFSDVLGNISSRFSGMGSGARRSSGFQNVTGQAASDFAQQLQAQRLGLQRQALGDLMGMSSMLLGQRPSESFLVEKKQPFWQQLLAGASGGLSSLFGGLGLSNLTGSKQKSTD